MSEVRFGPYRLELDRRRLTREGKEIALGSRALDVLCVLASAKGDLVTKDELMASVWPGIVVEDNTIQVHISALRKAIDDSKSGSGYVMTVPGRGYRFIGTQEPISASISEALVQHPADLDKPSIAVLAFTNLSGDIDQEYFADGISEDIITALSRYRHLFVIARNSSFTYKGRAVDVKQVGQQLGVRYVLEGSVRKAGNRIRIAAQLIDASSGHHVWAERYDRDLVDIFSVQDEITERVAGAIEPEVLKIEAGRTASRTATNLSAWDLVRQGTWHFHQVTPAGHSQARELFRKAIKLDPKLPDGHIWLARVSAGLVAYGWSENPPKCLDEGLRAAQTAVQIDERNPYSHYALAIISAYSDTLEQATRAAEEAVEISPSFALGYFVLGMSRLFAGHPSEAIAAYERGLRLNPYDPQNFVWFYLLALSFYFSGQTDNALLTAIRSTGIRSTWLPGAEMLALCYVTLGRMDEARACVKKMGTLEKPKSDLIAPFKVHNPRWSETMAATLRKAGWDA